MITVRDLRHALTGMDDFAPVRVGCVDELDWRTAKSFYKIDMLNGTVYFVISASERPADTGPKEG
jgi:hypothetical protein